MQVRIAAVRGSAPRDAGTVMTVTDTGQSGTIGGGTLEWEATRIARDMLREGRAEAQRSFALGPGLGQCCGGHVELEFSTAPMSEAQDRPDLWIWGAGHVGRAIAGLTAGTEAFAVTLIDTTADRLPDTLPEGVSPVLAADMPRLTPHAPATAHHLILTYSHDIDLALCDALLRRDTASIGLIGSATKWARFSKRLAEMGNANADIARISCPIGDPGLGKHPQAIAVGVAAALLKTGTSGDTNA